MVARREVFQPSQAGAAVEDARDRPERWPPLPGCTGGRHEQLYREQGASKRSPRGDGTLQGLVSRRHRRLMELLAKS